MPYLGVDAGTTAVKAAVFDADLTRVAIASRPTETLTPQPGWSEQDMNAVWAAAREAIREVVSKVGGDSIKAMAVAGQGDGLWMLGADGRPVRNAILWNDQRAASVIDAWSQNGAGAAFAKACRTALWPGTSAAIFAWLRENEPVVASHAATLFNAKDWIGHQLTGKIATDFSDATIPFLDIATRAYAPDAFAASGLASASDMVRPPKQAGERLGHLAPAVAGALGLPPGLPVAIGALDIAAMHVGAGMCAAGDALVILGTTAVVSVVTEPRAATEKIIGATVLDASGAHWLNVQAPQSGASAIDWSCARFPETFPDGAADVARRAAEAPSGANGVLFLPFLTGERAPFVAPEASAGFLGLRGTSTTADMARAVLEGVAFSLRHCIEATETDRLSDVTLTGGGAKSAIWRQIIADILRARVGMASEDEFGARGAAALAAHSLGEIDAFAPTLRPAQNVIEPRRGSHDLAAVDAAYHRYRQTVAQISFRDL